MSKTLMGLPVVESDELITPEAKFKACADATLWFVDADGVRHKINMEPWQVHVLARYLDRKQDRT
jgi:hypothetical protein